jgi:hypothetical protein
MAEQTRVNSPGRGSLAAVVGGVVLMLGGGVLIALAWNGAASLDYLQGQFPYLLSGSLPGLALVLLGGSVLVLNALRRDAAERSQQMQRLTAAIRRAEGTDRAARPVRAHDGGGVPAPSS